MDEQAQIEVKGKKPGILRRVIWWVWVILLILLLAACLILATPWKVITLIAIFLAAATILPRTFRKWFWLGVGVIIIALIVWIFLPEDNKGWRPYTFSKEAAELQARYAVPDSENAAIIYNQILETWKQKEPNEPNLPDCWFDYAKYGPWLNKDQPEIAAYLWYRRDTIEGLLQAAQFDKCSFPIVATSTDFSKDLQRLSTTRQWAYLLIAAGNNALGEGDVNEAMEKYRAVLQIGQHMSQQPQIVDMLVGIACEALGLGGINSFVILGDANELYLKELEQAVTNIKHDWSFDLPGFIDSDKLMFKNMCGWMWYQVDAKGRTRLTRDPAAMIREMYKEELSSENAEDINAMAALQKWINPGFLRKKLFKAFAILYWFYAPATPDKFSKIVDRRYENNYKMTKPDFDWSKEPKEVPIESLFRFNFKLNFRRLSETMAKTNETLYFQIHDIYLKRLAEQRGTLLIIAIRRYKNANGHWPEKLEDIENYVPAEILIDPINCGAFVYKLTEDNFTLYSRGKNNIDEDGEYEDKYSDDYLKHEIIKDDEMIWPKGKKAKTEEEKVNAE